MGRSVTLPVPASFPVCIVHGFIETLVDTLVGTLVDTLIDTLTIISLLLKARIFSKFSI